MKNDILSFVRKHSSTLLCIAAAGGLVTTAVLAVRETPKALELLERKKAEKEDLTVIEKTVTVFSAYIPAMVSGVLTIACIFGANALNMKQQAAMASAYALLNSNYKRYSGKVKELYGEKAHQRILDSLAAEKANAPVLYAETFCTEATLGFEGADEEKMIFYDAYSGRYFESTLGQVVQAEYHINRNFAGGREITVEKEIKTVGNIVSPYARFFDEANLNWEKDSEYNRMFLELMQQRFNDMLKSKGYLFLNDVYDGLGFPRTKMGQIVGWVYDENNPTGDNYVDFCPLVHFLPTFFSKMGSKKSACHARLKGVCPLSHFFGAILYIYIFFFFT